MATRMVRRTRTRSRTSSSPSSSSCGCSDSPQTPTLSDKPEAAIFLGALDGLVRAGVINVQVRDEILLLLDSKGAFCKSDNGGMGEGISPVAIDPYQRTVTYDGNVAAGPGNYRSYHGYRILC